MSEKSPESINLLTVADPAVTSATERFDVSRFKAVFPLFAQPENTALVYLDNAATCQRPAPVIHAITDFYLHANANTHRSSHRLARQATTMLEQVRAQAARYFGLTEPGAVVFCHGATAGLNLLAAALGQTLAPGDEIIVSAAEHHANLVPWQMAAQRHQLVLRFLPASFDATSLGAFVNERTRVVALTAASNALGQRTPLADIRSVLQGRDVCWVVDGSQLAAHEPVDVAALGCDFFVCAPHKFYGPTGVGLVVGKPAQWQRLPPWQGGGEMIERVTLAHTVYAEPPHRFETGTQPLAAIAGLGALFTWLEQQDRAGMLAHEQALLAYAHRQLAMLDGIRLLTSSENNVGIINLLPTPASGLAAADLGVWLDARDIAVRVGQHCAMPLMAELEVAASLRISIAAYNTQEDIDRCVAAIGEALVASVLPSALPSSLSPSLPSSLPESDLELTNTGLSGDDLSACSLAALTAVGNWQARYKTLLQWSQFIKPKPAMRVPAYQVTGCESAAWLAHWQVAGHHYFAIDSDSRIVRGLAVVLLLLIDGRTSDELIRLDPGPTFAELGLERHLSPSRQNGFWALLQRARDCVSTQIKVP